MNALTLLKQYNLRNTDARQQVLNVFIQNSGALTASFIERQLHTHDRVTIYRTLNTFVEVNLLHRVPDDSGIARYALTKSDLKNQIHSHFHCTTCDSTQCIDTSMVINTDLPAGYIIRHADLLFQGICPKCQD